MAHFIEPRINHIENKIEEVSIDDLVSMDDIGIEMSEQELSNCLGDETLEELLDTPRYELAPSPPPQQSLILSWDEDKVSDEEDEKSFFNAARKSEKDAIKFQASDDEDSESEDEYESDFIDDEPVDDDEEESDVSEDEYESDVGDSPRPKPEVEEDDEITEVTNLVAESSDFLSTMSRKRKRAAVSYFESEDEDEEVVVAPVKKRRDRTSPSRPLAQDIDTDFVCEEDEEDSDYE